MQHLQSFIPSVYPAIRRPALKGIFVQVAKAPQLCLYHQPPHCPYNTPNTDVHRITIPIMSASTSSLSQSEIDLPHLTRILDQRLSNPNAAPITTETIRSVMQESQRTVARCERTIEVEYQFQNTFEALSSEAQESLIGAYNALRGGYGAEDERMMPLLGSVDLSTACRYLDTLSPEDRDSLVSFSYELLPSSRRPPAPRLSLPLVIITLSVCSMLNTSGGPALRHCRIVQYPPHRQ